MTNTLQYIPVDHLYILKNNLNALLEHTGYTLKLPPNHSQTISKPPPNHLQITFKPLQTNFKPPLPSNTFSTCHQYTPVHPEYIPIHTQNTSKRTPDTFPKHPNTLPYNHSCNPNTAPVIPGIKVGTVPDRLY